MLHTELSKNSPVSSRFRVPTVASFRGGWNSKSCVPPELSYYSDLFAAVNPFSRPFFFFWPPDFRRTSHGAERARTANLLVANQALSQLSYGPVTSAVSYPLSAFSQVPKLSAAASGPFAPACLPSLSARVSSLSG
jgi:hypothetical protein